MTRGLLMSSSIRPSECWMCSVYLRPEMQPAYIYKTRQEASGALRQVPGAEARLDLAERCWCWRAAKTYHTLPVGIKNLVKQAKFKVELKAWVMKNVEP